MFCAGTIARGERGHLSNDTVYVLQIQPADYLILQRHDQYAANLQECLHVALMLRWAGGPAVHPVVGTAPRTQQETVT